MSEVGTACEFARAVLWRRHHAMTMQKAKLPTATAAWVVVGMSVPVLQWMSLMLDLLYELSAG